MAFGLTRASQCLHMLASWPSTGSTIPRNPIVVLQGGGGEELERWMRNLDEQRPALVCAGLVIPLTMRDIFLGIGETKALLAPVRRLPPRTRCELTFRRPSPGPLLRYDGSSNEPTSSFPWWITSESDDRKPPKWQGKPTLQAGTRTNHGCGEDVRLDARVPISDKEGPVLVIVRAGAGKGPLDDDFVLEPEDGHIDIGHHHQCGGAFAFEGENAYRVSFLAIDAAGNKSRVVGPLHFTAP